MPPNPAPSCLLCRHFQTTWEVANPRGCTFYGFKSREYPSAVVLRESGTPCQAYTEKPGIARTLDRPRDR